MGMVSDFIDGIGDWFNDMIQKVLKQGIKSCFDNIQDILDTTYKSSTKDNGLINIFLAKHPAQFTGSVGNASGGYGIWATIENLCNDVVVPIAGFILTIILVSDLITMCIRGNNFKDVDETIIIKWIIKCLCGVLLVSNTYYIASGLFSFGTNVCANGISTVLNGNLSTTDYSTALYDSLGSYSNGALLIMLLLSFLIMVAVFLLTVVIVLVMASRMIEVFMYLGVSPIPMATMMNEGWSSVGKNWIKGVIALSFQGFFIVIALAIFKTIFNNVVLSISKADDGVIMSLLLLAGYSAALIYTVLRSGSISKSIFNAS
jgi:hypothetical protein